MKNHSVIRRRLQKLSRYKLLMRGFLKGEIGSMPISPYLEICSVTRLEGDNKTILGLCQIQNRNKIVDSKVMIDCGAGGEFIN
jgi:hypothetical protein